MTLLLFRSASAFCGTYVSAYEETPTNHASEVVLTRLDGRTTLTVANDVQGDTRDFAMVIPVPEVLAKDAIHVVDPDVFERLRGYSNPREVSYTCEDFERDSGFADTGMDYEGGGDSGDSGTGVTVEAQYIVGEYDITILSAEESGSLVTWLQANGYSVPDASAELLGEYIEGGAFFFAAQVREDAGIESGATLSPLQFSYAAETFGLPIRIGTLNSPGEQDLRIYAITDYEDGAVAIANYDEEELDTDCMWQPEAGESLTEWYDNRLDTTFGNVDGAAWITEYSWGNGHCDPCTGIEPSIDDLYTLGLDENRTYWFTRLHMRYSPTTADQDLVLYTSGIQVSRQMRYVQYQWELEDRFPICDVGWVDSPGSCTPGPYEDTGAWRNDAGGELDCGCGEKGSAALGFLVLGGLVRRRRT